MKKITMFFVAAIIALSAAAQPVQIRLNLQEGQTYKQKMISDVQMQQTMNGTTMDINTKVYQTTDYTVKGISGDTYTMEVKYTTLGMDMTMPFGNTTMSSEKTGDPASEIFKGMTGQPFTMIVNRQGKVLEVIGVDQVIDNALNSVTSVPAAQKAQVSAVMQQSFSAEAMKNNFETMTSMYPTASVVVNDTWQAESSPNSSVPTPMTTDYQYKGVEGNNYIISGSAKVDTGSEGVEVEQDGTQIKFVMNGTSNSEIKINRNTGWVAENVIDMKMDMVGHMDIGMGQEVEIPISMTMRTIFSDN